MNQQGSQELAGHRVRVTLPSAPVESASIKELEERMRSASETKAKV